MHFRLPKPLHGWREFAGEVGIIVVGVLIALAAEALVQKLDWDARVRAGREALRADYVTIIANAREREGEDRCIRARLLQLRNLLNAGADSLPALGHIGSPPGRPWYPRSWDSLIASDVSTHMPRDQMLAFANIAGQARSAEEAADRELDDWATLYTMVGPARKLAPDEAAQLRKSLSDAAYQLNVIRLVAPQVEKSILETNLLTRADFREAQRQGADSLRGPNAQHICGPILPPDPWRVDAPYDPAVQLNPLGGRDEKENR
jgi:hypothetical protein